MTDTLDEGLFERRTCRCAAGLRGERTHDLYRLHLRRRLRPAFGAVEVQRITPDRIAAVIAKWRAEGLGESTIRGAFIVLGRVLKLALRRGYIASNPLERLENDERPGKSRGHAQRVLDHAEIERLLAAAPTAYRPMIAAALYSGLRQAELLGLTWADVDFDTGLIHVHNQLSRATNDRPARLIPLKTDKSRRDVVLLPQLGRLLREYKLASRFSSDADYVFTTESGKPHHYRNVSRRGLERAVRDAGIASLRWHDLRHTFASHLILDLGLDVAQVARQLGHASPSITLDVYTHIFDQARHHEDIRSKMEASSFGRLLEGQIVTPA